MPRSQVILKEMEIFQKPKDGKGNIFLVEPRGQRGIHCRFGMPGVSGVQHMLFVPLRQAYIIVQ